MKTLIEKAKKILAENEEAIKKEECNIQNVHCSWCANCSGIVGD